MFWQKNPHSLPKHLYGGVGKWLFITLMYGSCVLLCLFILLAWLIPYVGFSAIHVSLPYVLGIVSAVLILCVAWMCVTLVYYVYTGKNIWGLKKVHGLTVRLMFPLMLLLGRVLRVPRENIRLSFVKVNNEMVLGELGNGDKKIAPEKILVLLPHCIQNAECPYRASQNINLCRRCGKCTLGEILDLRDAFGCAVVIATGGTIARKIVVETRPKLILAVACERDLTSGIQDTYPLPVFGIINERPFGPCFNTNVKLPLLKEALQKFTGQDFAVVPHPENTAHEEIEEKTRD